MYYLKIIVLSRHISCRTNVAGFPLFIKRQNLNLNLINLWNVISLTLMFNSFCKQTWKIEFTKFLHRMKTTFTICIYGLSCLKLSAGRDGGYLSTTLERTLEFASKLVVITVIMRTWRWCRQERDRETRDITSRDIERYWRTTSSYLCFAGK